MEHFTELKISNPSLLRIDLGEGLAKAFSIMKKNNVRHLVVTRDEKAIGVLSDRDVMRAINVQVHDFYSVRVKEESFSASVVVGDVMGWPIHTLESSAPLLDMLQLMLERKISCVLLTQDSMVSGIVTTDDILKIFRQVLVNDSKSAEIPATPANEFLASLYSSPVGRLFEMLSNTGI